MTGGNRDRRRGREGERGMEMKYRKGKEERGTKKRPNRGEMRR